MLNETIARRYAQAIFELADEKSMIKTIGEEFVLLDELIAQNNELKNILNNPNIEAKNKIHIVEKILGENFSNISKNSILILIDHRRQNLLTLIQKELTRLSNESNNLIEAKVFSAIPLSSKQKEKIKLMISKSTGKTIALINEINPNLIGGIKVKIGSCVIDGSIMTTLNKLQRELKESPNKLQKEVGVD